MLRAMAPSTFAKSSARRTAVQHAIRAISAAQAELSLPIEQVFALLAAEANADGRNDSTPREATAAARLARREQMMDELRRRQQGGMRRGLAKSVARMFARDPLDPIEVESLRRQLHRWWREDKKTGHCPVADQKIG